MVPTVAALFYEALKRELPDALAHKVDGAYVPISHSELQAQVERLALVLEAGGLRPGDRVALLSENRPEWAVVDFACAVSGLVSVPIYQTLSSEQTEFILRDSGARWIFCADPALLQKVMDRWEYLPDLEAAVLFGGTPPADPRVRSWARVQGEGAASEARRGDVRIWAEARRPEDLLTLIYTSGTTGDPKGAMLSHGNIVTNAKMVLDIIQPLPGDRALSLLPLSHVFERTIGHYTFFHCGVALYYAESLQTLAQNLLEVQPTVMTVVPRVLEKIYIRIRESAADRGPLALGILAWAIRVGRKVSPFLYRGARPSLALGLAWKVADLLLFHKIRARTGGRIRFMGCGGAPLAPRLIDFFWAAGVPIYEGYGLTETSPVLALNRAGQVKPGFVGPPVLDSWEGKPFVKLAEDGEILARGPNLMLGYWKDEAATREILDPEGYLRTGDVGEMDEAGRIKITDRKKEILVTSGGKNIAPQPIENLLRTDKYIEQAVVIGDNRNFLSALIVPNFLALRRWAAREHLVFKEDADLVRLPEVQAKLLRRVGYANAKLAQFEQVRKIALLDKEMTPEAGLLTPSLKIKRRVVAEVFRDRIEALYEPSLLP